MLHVCDIQLDQLLISKSNILGCHSMSVYSGSDYTESNCYDQKQVAISSHIKSNLLKFILLKPLVISSHIKFNPPKIILLKQVAISSHIKSNPLIFILLKHMAISSHIKSNSYFYHATGHRPSLRVALGLDCWRMWEGDKEPFFNLGEFVLRFGMLSRE